MEELSPDDLATVPEEPELWPENLRSYRAFWQLNPDRPEYFAGVGHIPVAAMAPYAEAKHLDFDELLGDLRFMDQKFLEVLEDRRNEERQRAEREAERRAKFGGGHVSGRKR